MIFRWGKGQHLEKEIREKSSMLVESPAFAFAQTYLGKV